MNGYNLQPHFKIKLYYFFWNMRFVWELCNSSHGYFFLFNKNEENAGKSHRNAVKKSVFFCWLRGVQMEATHMRVSILSSRASEGSLVPPGQRDVGWWVELVKKDDCILGLEVKLTYINMRKFLYRYIFQSIMFGIYVGFQVLKPPNLKTTSLGILAHRNWEW